MPDSNNRTTIIVAVLALMGTLAAALFANWDKIFPRGVAPSSSAVPANQPKTRDHASSSAEPDVRSKPLDKQQRRADAEAQGVSYKKMDFGFNGCAAKFGAVLKGVTEEDMIKRASAANANGFAFNPSLGYGTLLLGEYPKGCKSPSNLSWPLYLRE